MGMQLVVTWNTQVLIESYSTKLEDLYQVELENSPLYIKVQMVGKVITSIESCGTF